VALLVTGRRVRRGEPATSRHAHRAAAESRRQLRLDAQGEAAATGDRFLDAIVLLSVLAFLALVVGVGVLALQASSTGWPW
jgi:hypothetical protein